MKENPILGMFRKIISATVLPQATPEIATSLSQASDKELPVSRELLSQCVGRSSSHDGHQCGFHTQPQSISLDDVSQITINKPDPSSLDRIPRDYMDSPFGVGDTYHIEIVSFITSDNKVLYSIVPQDIDHYVDDAGQNKRYIESGKRIGEVLEETKNIKYVVIYRWQFNGNKDIAPKVNKKTLEIMEVV